MLVEMTVRELISNTERIDTKKRHHIADQVQLLGGYQAQRVDQNALVFAANTNTGHHPKIRADVTIQDDAPVSITASDGTAINIQPIKMHYDDVMVSCDCEDFYFRFATANSKAGVLFGSITKQYVPKGTGHQVASDTPAVCKHLIRLTHLLQSQGVLR